MSYGQAIDSETGFDLDVTGNLFMDGGWGKGSGGCGNNCDGTVGLNSSGGFNVPGSRYENQVLISNNQFVDDWQGIDIWQAGSRSCENSGESWPNDASYCSGGFPNSASTASGGQYDFSHEGDSAHGGANSLAGPATAGSSTILVAGTEAIDDQIGFGNPVIDEDGGPGERRYLDRLGDHQGQDDRLSVFGRTSRRDVGGLG